MLAAYKETETDASRVIYINSKDATSVLGGNRSDFNFVLEEPIVVPEHHNILLPLYEKVLYGCLIDPVFLSFLIVTAQFQI